MTAWLFLAAAILAEVTATLALRMAALAHRGWYVLMAIGYAAAFAALATSLSLGMPLGVAYGIWAAAGVALTALASRIFFAEPLTRVMLLGIALIMAGVLLIEIGATA